MKIITSIFVKYPKLFEGKTPVAYTEVPEGWANLLEGFCILITSRSTEAQLADFFIEKISCSERFLDLEYSLSPTFSEYDAFAVGARAFAIKNRSCVGCVHCGALMKTVPEEGEWPLCERRTCRKAAARILKALEA